MKKIKIILLLLILIILLHVLPKLYKNRIPSNDYNSVKIEGAIIVYIPDNTYNYKQYDMYYILDGTPIVKSGNEVNKGYEEFREKIKRKQIVDSAQAQERINFLNKKLSTKWTLDSILFSPTFRYGLKLELDWRLNTRKILDASSGNIIMEIPVWSSIYTPHALAWSSDGYRLAISISDTVHDSGEYGLLILDLSSKQTKYFKFDRSIESVDWSPSFKKAAVITKDLRYVYCPVNILFRLSGHNLLYWSYYLAIIDVELGSKLEFPIVKDTERSCCSKVYWLK